MLAMARGWPWPRHLSCRWRLVAPCLDVVADNEPWCAWVVASCYVSVRLVVNAFAFVLNGRWPIELVVRVVVVGRPLVSRKGATPRGQRVG